MTGNEAQLFAAMPNYEGMKRLLSSPMSRGLSKAGRLRKIALIDIKRAHLKAPVQREIFIDLPWEDREEASRLVRVYAQRQSSRDF